MDKNNKKQYQKPEYKKFFKEPQLKKEGKLNNRVGTSCSSCASCTSCA